MSPVLENGLPSEFLCSSVSRALSPLEQFYCVRRWDVSAFDGQSLLLRFVTSRALTQEEEVDTLSVAVAEVNADFFDLDVGYEVVVETDAPDTHCG